MFYKKLIYICSPVRGDVKANIERARGYCKTAVEMGYIPIAPHVAYEGLFDDEVPHEREVALLIGLELVKKCDELWIFTDHISEGMKNEIAYARQLGMPIKTVTHEG